MEHSHAQRPFPAWQGWSCDSSYSTSVMATQAEVVITGLLQSRLAYLVAS